MKNFIFCGLFTVLFLVNKVSAQNMAINTTGAVPDGSAMLDIASTSKGFLAPRMTTTQQTAIVSPATGLLIYNLTDNAFKVNTGTPGAPVWTALGATTNNWLLTGNSGASSSANFLGSTDKVNLAFRTNNTQRMVIDTSGRVGIGAATFNVTYPEKFLVDAGTTTSVNAIVGKGNINSYLQLNIQNNSAGTNSSSDVVATANNGDEANNFVDMGINGGNNISNVMGTANDAYLYNMGQNFIIGTGTFGKSLMFLTGGTDSSYNERMRIDGSGNVGIGVGNPAYKLQVNATADPLQLIGLQTGTNTDSLLTVSNGVVKRLSPSALTTSSSNAWALAGNSGTSYANHFLGTSDNKSLRLRTNNIQRMIIDSSSGYVGIGSANFDAATPEQLLVDGGTSVNNIINAVGNQNSYVQIGVQNKNSGNNASSDVIATNNYTANGTTYPYYVDLGINSSGYTNGASNLLNQPHTAYIYSVSPQDFYIGNGSANKGLVFFTYGGAVVNGNNSADGTERVRITSTGNIGFGDFSGSNPAYLVTAKGTIAPYASNGAGSGDLGSSTNRWGTVYATNALNTSSDRRLKTNIANLNYGLKEVMAMQPVSYNWKTTPTIDKKLGLIAQDVRKLVPEVVKGDEAKENLSIAYSDLIPVLINAIKEQQQQIDELKKTIKALENKK
ncbi:MAG: tail fiber protein [Ferruginibacter sp.]|nr:tail fiber protein [Ferruginibacter sp.]